VSPPVEIPPSFAAGHEAGDVAFAEFHARLPGLLREVLAEWGLGVDGPATHGACALVVPVRTPAGRPLSDTA